MSTMTHSATRTTVERAPEAPAEKFGWVLPIVLMGYFLILLNNSIVFTSNRAIASDFGMDRVAVSWVSNAYALTFGGFLLLAGRLGDLFGRKRLLVAGLAVFAASSLLVGLAPSAGMLIAMRAVQGIGAALLTPATLALLLDSYEGQMRTRAVAYYGTVAGLGGALGMVVGGVIANYASWRYGFFLDVPVSIALLALTSRFVRTERALGSGGIDSAGSILSVLGFSSLVYAISGTSMRGLAAIAAVVLLTSFVVVETRARMAIVPLDLFTDMGRSGAYLGRFLLWGASMTYFFMMPTAMQEVFGYSPLQSAVAFLPLSIAQFGAALLVPRLLARLSVARTILLGTVVIVLGYLLGWTLGIDAGYVLGVCAPMLLIGAGQGLAVSPLTVAGVHGARPADAGAASGVVNVASQIGGAVGLALISRSVAGAGAAGSIVHAQALMTLLMLVALVSSLVMLWAEHRSSALEGHAHPRQT